MDTTDVLPVIPPVAAPAPVPVPPPTVGSALPVAEHCPECQAPVEPAQRYCVVCGAHRSHVEDPAARYLQRAARRRGLVTTSVTGPAPGPGLVPVPGRRASRGLGLAVALALIPAAAAAGVLAGRSSNSTDAGLIQALARRSAPTVTVATGSATAGGAGTAPSPVGPHASAHSRHRASAARVPAGAGTKIVARTRYGAVNQVTGFKATKAAEQQGAQATQQVQKAKGKAYVSSQDNLPSQVVVP